jgi:hypothetical protein
MRRLQRVWKRRRREVGAMATADQIAANRRNARRSTGPRTAAGKRKAAVNSLTHGVTVSLHADPAAGAVARRIASFLAGSDASAARLARVMPVAEAEAELLRIRNARAALINLASARLPEDSDRETDAVVQSLTTLVRLDRYERRAMARRTRALCHLRNFEGDQ